MGALDLSAQVLNISPGATKDDVIEFFSYCGTIDEIQLQRDGDESQSAILTFRQPYAVKTALLLNDAIMLDRRVRVLPLESRSVPIVIRSSVNKQTQERRGFTPAAPAAAAAGGGREVMSKVTDRVSEVGKTLLQQTTTAISATEQMVGSIGSTISNSSYFARSTGWLSNTIDRASKSKVQLGNAKARHPSSMKQK